MERIGRYEVLEELGRGFMGAVFKARDAHIDRTVAIKIILTANLSAEALEQYKQRFRREAQAAGRMSHPGIVTIYDIAEDEAGQPYLVMEYVDGTPLDKLLTPGSERRPLGQTLDIGRQVAEALEYAHQRGVIHRDIKPANILVTRDARAKVADFGIAKLAGAQLTQAGQLLGTPAFMSPEQFSGADVDARTDLFSLGAVLYWMCTGEKPFAGDTLTAVSFKIVYTAPIPPRTLNPSLPADLDIVLGRCLAKSPADRYASCAELAADLERLQAGRPVAARPLAPPTVGDTIAVPGPQQPAARGELRRARPGVRETLADVPSVAPVGILSRAQKFVARRSGGPAWGAATWAALKLALSAVGGRAATLRRSKLAWGVAFVLGLVLFGVGYWFWTREDAASPAAADPVAASKPAGDERSVARAAAPPPIRSAARARRPPAEDADERPARPVAWARLRVVCEHNLRSATLEITADDQRVLSATLRGERQDFGVLHVYQGRTETSAPISAGRHTLRVRVSAPGDNYEDVGEITGSFPDGGSRTLFIEFGKGSALGVVERRLTLSWR